MAETQPSSRRRGRPEQPELAARRREEILDAATALFASRGFARTDLQVVADRLGVGKGTLYRYFPAKKALFLAAVDRGMRQLHDHVEAEAEKVGPPLAKIETAILAYFRFFHERPEIVELLMQERATFRDRKKPTYFVHLEQNIHPWVELVRELIDDGVIRDLPADHITDMLSRMLYGVMFTNYFSSADRTPEEQAAEIIDFMFNGILRRGRRTSEKRKA